MVRHSIFWKLTCLFICLSTLTAVCQRYTQLDSLTALLKTTGSTPTEEVVILRNKIVKLYKQQNLRKALIFAEETLPIALTVGNPDLLTNAYASAADLANLTGDFKKGATYSDNATKFVGALSDSLGLAKKFIVLMNKGGWISPLISAEEKIGYGLRSLEIYTKLKNEPGMANASTELANAYKNKALYHSKGISANDSADFRQARNYLKRACDYNQKTKNIPQWAYCLTLQAIMEKQLGLHEKAFRLNRKALKLYNQENCLLGAALPMSELADIFLAKKQYDSALWYLKHSIELYNAVGYKGTINELYERESGIYARMNQYENALSSMKKAKKESEEKYKTETTRSIIEIENKFENQLKEAEIQSLTADKLLSEKSLHQKNIILASIALISFVTIAGLLAYQKQKQKTLQSMKEKADLGNAVQRTLENQLNQVQLQALQGQMNPHFIYNALSSIQGLILQEDKNKAITYLEDFAHLSRFTLENSRKERIKLKDEIRFITRYLELESLRHQFKFKYEIIVDEKVDADFETIPPMLIQPFVENAIRHGLIPKNEDRKLSIHFMISLQEDAFVCVIDDNGIGRAQSMKNKEHSEYKSMSTDVNEARLKLINDKQDLRKTYKIDIEDKYDEQHRATGTRVGIYFAFHSEKIDEIKNGKSNHN